MSRGVSRYSQRPFPAYRYVPGLTPHPTRDRRGHSHAPAGCAAPPQAWTPENWAALPQWLYGVDLFNHGYFWEAHEAWEGLWRTVPATEPQALLLQGLIQIAAALLKARNRGPAAAHLAQRGLDKLERVATTCSTLMGLDLARTQREMTAWLAALAAAGLDVDRGDWPRLKLAI